MAYQNRSVRRNSGKRLKSRMRGGSQQHRLNQQGAGKKYCPFNYKYCSAWSTDIPLDKRCVKSKILDSKSIECGVRGDKRMGAAPCLEKNDKIPITDYGEECKV